MVCPDHAVLCGHVTAFYHWQKVSLYAFTRDICAAVISSFSDLVHFVNENDTGLFDGLNGRAPKFVLVYKFCCFLVSDSTQGVFYRHFF